MKFWRKLTMLFRRHEREADMAAEMQAHLDLQARAHQRAGMTADDASRAARLGFGGIERHKEAARDQRGLRWLEDFFADVRYAFRALGKQRGFALAAGLTLALGVGFVTTLFTMINGVALARLPFPEGDRIMAIGVAPERFDDLAGRQQSFTVLSFAQSVGANLRLDAGVSRHAAAIVPANFFESLRIAPLLGRGFLPSDEQPAAVRSVVLGHALWVREFQADSRALGREVHVNGERHIVIGVMPPGFGFPRNEQLWLPRIAGVRIADGVVFGRLRADVSRAQAAAEFSALSAHLAPPSLDRVTPPPVVEVVPFTERGMKPALRIMLTAILAATFLVLLLACANVTNLLLARAVDRRKELAVRAAIGATRPRLMRQLLTESLILAVGGALGGLALAWTATRLLWDYLQQESALTGGAPFWVNFNVDARVFGFVAGTALLATVLTGLAPALQASRVNLNVALKQGEGTGLRLSGVSRFLVHVQMAFSVCLVTVSGLFVTILLTFNRKDLPYDPRTILTARVVLGETRYDSENARRVFFEHLSTRLGSAPGIQAMALNSAEALRSAPSPRIEFEGEAYAREADRPASLTEVVSPGFLDVFPVAVSSGRAFTALDTPASLPVAMVNPDFVRQFGRDRPILGRRFRLAGGDGSRPWITIVGVAPELGSVKAGQPSRGPLFYRPLAQEPVRAVTVLLRGEGAPAQRAAALRQEVAALDRELPLAQLQTVQDIVELERVGMNAFAVLFIVCGVGALTLASVGVYGVVAFSVRMRKREFGIRLALGADRRAILRLIVGEGLRQIAVGLGIGALLALAVTLATRGFFAGFGRSDYDLWIYGGVVLLLGAVGAVALLLPALRAARTNPLVVLRSE